MTLKADPSQAPYGQKVTLRGTVTDRAGAPVNGNDIRVQAVSPNGTVGVLDDVTYTTVADRTTDFVARYDSDLTHMGGQSSKARLTVSSLLSLVAAKKSVAVGKAIVLTARARPVGRGAALVVEQLVKGKWKRVATAKSDSKGTAVVKLKAAKTGKATYRVRRATTDAAGGEPESRSPSR